MKTKDLKNLMESTIFDEVKRLIINESNEGRYETHQVTCEDEPVKSCKSHGEAEEVVNKLEKEHPGKQFMIEKKTYNSYSEMIDELDTMGEQLEETENNDMKEELKGGQKKLDKNHNGKIDGQDFKILKGQDKEEVEEQEEECDECNSMEEEETLKMENIKIKPNKKIVRLTESELIKLISKMVNEANAVPGLEILKTTRTGSGKENTENLSNVEKKMKDYLSFDGNDNPEFDDQISTGEKVTDNNTEEENDFVDTFRGGTLLDLNYDSEPSQQYKDRMKKALEGDSTMGNSPEAGNIIKTKTGENLAKVAEKKQKTKEEMPMYQKDAAPIKNVNESENESTTLLENEIKRMKSMVDYNKKTQ